MLFYLIMAKKLKLQNFLRNIDDQLLKQYFTQVSISVNFPDEKQQKNREKLLEDQILALDEQDNDKVEGDFLQISELATEGGLLSLLEIASEDGNSIAGEIEQIENYHNQSLSLL